MNQVILGKGEIGKAVSTFLKGEINFYDKGQWEDAKYYESDATYIHIAFPFHSSTEFLSLCELAHNRFPKAELFIVHSTVSPGTCRELGEKFVYSPCMGRHADGLASSMRNYDKFYACESKQSENKMHEFIEEAIEYDIIFKLWEGTKDELEFSKIMSTGYMFWNLIYQKQLHNICQERGYNFDVVYKEWNRNYNGGIENFDMMRPIYEWDDDPVPGGHCLVPNIYLDKNKINGFLENYLSVDSERFINSAQDFYEYKRKVSHGNNESDVSS